MVVWIPEMLPECPSEGPSECRKTWQKYHLEVCKSVWKLVGIAVYMSEGAVCGGWKI